MTGAGAWTACGTSDRAQSLRADVDPGPTFGLEITVAIKGRGRVVSSPSVIDCPSDCFARIVLADPTVDGARGGLALSAEATNGAHFAGWSYDLIEVGTRARGPSQCSPMSRSTAAPPVIAGSSQLALQYGETKGTPPVGLEAECADFTSVPVAYALTATFLDEDSGVLPLADAGIEQLFAAPRNNVRGREIGVAGGMVYWLFVENAGNVVGIAAGPSTGGGDAGVSRLVVDPLNNPGESVGSFSVDRHVLFQNARGELKSILAGTETPLLLYNGFSVASCPWVASNSKFGYCRYSNGGQASLYAWLVGGGGFAGGYSLPTGNLVTVDGDHAYFTSDVDGSASIQSALLPEGGVVGIPPSLTTLATEQTTPRALAVGPTDLFWIDNPGGTNVTRSLPKGGGTAAAGVVSSNVRFLVPDPTSPTIFWVGLPALQPGQSSIVRASTFSGSIAAVVANLPSLGGLAVDATHVYWTQLDGRVFRAPKP